MKQTSGIEKKKPEQEDQTESPNKQLAPRKMHPLL